MARDMPLVGVGLSKDLSPNSEWYAAARLKTNSISTFSAMPTSFGSAIGDRTYSFTTRRGRTYELGRIESGEAQLQVDNSDGYFDPTVNTILPYRPLNVSCAYPVTGNILNNNNLAPLVDVNAPVTYADYRVSVGANDSNFELGVISNWFGLGGTASPSASNTYANSGSYSMFIPGNCAGSALDVPVVVGKQICVSVYYRHTGVGGNATLRVYDGAYLSPISQSVILTNTTSWTRASVTITPQSSKVVLAISVGGATGVYVDDVQVEFGSVPSTVSVVGSKIYRLFNGFVERYPQTFQAPNRGQANLVATDALASMSQVELNTLYQSYLLQDPAVALYYYPLSEPVDSTGAYNQGLFNQLPLVLQEFNNPLTGVTHLSTAAFGSLTAEELIGSATTGVDFYNANTKIDTGYLNGWYLTNDNINDVVFTSGLTYTFSMWAKLGWGVTEVPLMVANYGGTSQTSFQAPTNNSFAIYIDTDSKFCVQIRGTSSTSELKLAKSASTYTGNQWYFLSAEITYTGSSYTVALTVNNTKVTDTWSKSNAMTVQNIAVGAPYGFTTNTSSTTQASTVAHTSIHRGSITGSKYNAVNRYGQLVSTGSPDQTGTKFANMIHTFSGFNYLPYSADLGISAMQSFSPTGATLADFVQTIADTEGGDWFVDGAGFVTFKDRHKRLQKLTPSAIFGDGAGETPYEGGDLVINYDPTYVLNNVNVMRNAGTTAVAVDQTSVANYFPRSYSRTSFDTSDSNVVDAAFYLLSRYKDPHARPETITLTPMRNPAIWAVALGLEIGDYVRVNKRPLGASAISIDCFVERVEHAFDAQSSDWVTTVTLSPRIVSYWNLSSVWTTNTASSTPSLTLNKTGLNGSTLTVRDIIPGQLLQSTVSGTTSVYVVASVPTSTSTTVSFSNLKLGSFTSSSSTLGYTTTAGAFSGAYPLDSVGTFALTDGTGLTSFSVFWIDGELVQGSVAGNTLTITSRAYAGTIAKPHAIGSPIYGVTSFSGGSFTGGDTFTEILFNQLKTLPYSAGVVSTTLQANSVLDAWSGSLNNATYGTTTPASGIKYNSFVMNPITDRENYPQSDLAVGQIVRINGNENVAIAIVTSPDGSGVWAFNGYKVNSPNTLATDVSISGTTITTSTAVTASAIVVGMEFMQVTAGSGTTSLTVVRGTPDAVAFPAPFSLAPHYSGDVVYVIANAGCTGTYAVGNSVIESYNGVSVVGSTRLAF